MIEIISGTNRPSSNTLKIAREVELIYRNEGAEAQILDLQELPIEIYEPSAYDDKPAEFEAFSQRILDAEGLVFVAPEYNGGMPGALKYFIDMLIFPESFDRKIVCFIGLAAGVWGARRPVEQLQALYHYREGHVYPRSVFIPSVEKALNVEAKLENDAVKRRLISQAKGFIQFIDTLHNRTTPGI